MDPLVSLKGVVKSYRRGRQTVEVLHNLDLSTCSRASSWR